jgi:flagellar hook-basal body complex protein FliE
MSIEALAALGAHDEVAAPLPLRPAASAPAGAGFSERVAQGLQALDAQLKASQVDLQQLALGEATSLHEVMVRLEESRIAFQLMLQLRNRALEAYQEVMRMQV